MRRRSTMRTRTPSPSPSRRGRGWRTRRQGENDACSRLKSTRRENVASVRLLLRVIYLRTIIRPTRAPSYARPRRRLRRRPGRQDVRPRREVSRVPCEKIQRRLLRHLRHRVRTERVREIRRVRAATKRPHERGVRRGELVVIHRGEMRRVESRQQTSRGVRVLRGVAFKGVQFDERRGRPTNRANRRGSTAFAPRYEKATIVSERSTSKRQNSPPATLVTARPPGGGAIASPALSSPPPPLSRTARLPETSRTPRARPRTSARSSASRAPCGAR